MSRSYLHDKYQQRLASRFCKNDGSHSPHKHDERPKNRPSKYITTHGGAACEWYEEPGYCQGHRPKQGGHRLTSGIVRANIKREIQREIDEWESTR